MKHAIFALLVAMVSVSQATDYNVRIATSDIANADTDVDVSLKIEGENGYTSEINIDDPDRNDFQRGAVDDFTVSAEDVGAVIGFEVSRKDKPVGGSTPDWAFDYIGVKLASDEDYLTYYYEYWLPADTWLKFPRPPCGEEGHTCYYKDDPCPKGYEECIEYDCPLEDSNKCCCIA